jgi:transposase
MAMKAMSLVGLDARQTHAAVLVPDTGELRVSKLRVRPAEVVSLLEGLGAAVTAVYAAGPTGFGLARAARERGIDVRVAAPGSIPKGPGDRVKTDRRDAPRLVPLLAAGELRFAFVPSVADERFRDLVRCIEDARGDLMRARHRLSKFLLRHGERYPGPGGAWTSAHMAWLRARSCDDPCARATFVDYLAAEGLVVLGRVLEELEDGVVPAPVGDEGERLLGLQLREVLDGLAQLLLCGHAHQPGYARGASREDGREAAARGRAPAAPQAAALD